MHFNRIYHLFTPKFFRLINILFTSELLNYIHPDMKCRLKRLMRENVWTFYTVNKYCENYQLRIFSFLLWLKQYTSLRIPLFTAKTPENLSYYWKLNYSKVWRWWWLNYSTQTLFIILWWRWYVWYIHSISSPKTGNFGINSNRHHLCTNGSVEKKHCDIWFIWAPTNKQTSHKLHWCRCWVNFLLFLHHSEPTVELW